ncbi:hypothetical protein H8N03_13120 [Ramlibacter sp. USB13]|uniref:Uncharacterized protein n=1 Tax=Ramlibacter cellulosilyticus TaxID=2764187 RepID=A0A923MS01_9BURK|nr:hypothetical protein [Ramlibacter cellulosilyticus]MBC5783891.1 hypothetical protein [Ramlibacter cellulosilyticus]
MELLKEPPPAFESVARLFAMARQLPTSRRMNLRIGLACDGKLFAHDNLDGYRQVNFVADHLRDLGWREHLLGGEDEMFGCDMLFSWPGEHARVAEDDPSFIRKPAVDLWPGSHG